MTLEPIQYLLGAGSGSLVGFTLGLVGGGGSILGVPLMAYLVGVAQALSAMRDSWSGTIVLIGQPAEETLQGARAMWQPTQEAALL